MNLPKLKPMIPFLCICIGSLVAIIAAYVDYQNKLKEKQEQLDKEVKRNKEYENIINKNNDIIKKSNDIIESQQMVVNTTAKIIDLQNQLGDKNNKIQELQNNTINNITGGNNVPYMQIIYRSGGIMVVVSNKGSTPVYDLKLEIYNGINKPLEFTSPISPEIENNPFNTIPINLGLGENKILYSINFKNVNHLQHEFDIRWRNGSIQIGISLFQKDKEKVIVVILYHNQNIPLELLKNNLIINYSKVSDWEMGHENITFPR